MTRRLDRTSRLARLAALAEMKAVAARAQAARCLANEARASREVELLIERRREAAARLSSDAGAEGPRGQDAAVSAGRPPGGPRPGATAQGPAAMSRQVEAAPDAWLAQAAATSHWLKTSHAELRRLNIQQAALRARSETAKAEAARAAARQAVVERLRDR